MVTVHDWADKRLLQRRANEKQQAARRVTVKRLFANFSSLQSLRASVQREIQWQLLRVHIHNMGTNLVVNNNNNEHRHARANFCLILFTRTLCTVLSASHPYMVAAGHRHQLARLFWVWWQQWRCWCLDRRHAKPCCVALRQQAQSHRKTICLKLLRSHYLNLFMRLPSSNCINLWPVE